jgi:hypothetical protein
MKTRYLLAAATAAAGALLAVASLAPLRAGVDAPPFTVAVPFDPYTIIVGPGAGTSLQSGETQNTLGGYEAGGALTTNTYNTGWGYKALGQSTAHAGTGIGAGAGYSVGPGADDSTFIGADAGNNDDGTGLITGVDNLGAGVHTLGHLGSGAFNVAVGNESMVGCGTWVGVPSCPLLTGSSNTGIGNYTLENIQGAAAENTATGYSAGSALTTGCENVFDGSYAGDIVTTGCLDIMIGRAVNPPSATTGNYLNIGNLIQGTGLTQGGAPANGAVTIYGSLSLNGGAGLDFNGAAITAPSTEIDLLNSAGGRIAALNTSAPGATTCYPILSGGGGAASYIYVAGSCATGGTLTLGASGQQVASLVPIGLPGYTVSTLPSAPTGAMAYVTDATSCTYGGSLTGGGSTFCKVVYSGSAWLGG